MDTKRKEFDINDDLIFGSKRPKELNSDLKELKESNEYALPALDDQASSHESEPEVEDEESTNKEDKEYYDTNYWKNLYTGNFKIEQLLLE